MAQTATFTVKATIPIDDDPAIPAPIDLSCSLSFGQKVELELNYDAPVSDQSVPLGTLASAGAKVLIVKCPSGGCSIKLNDDISAKPIPASPGGVAWINTVAGWLTALKITTTGPAKVRVIALA